MAAPTRTRAPGRGGAGGRGARRTRGDGGEGPLKRLKLAVEEFVQAACEPRSPGGGARARVRGRGRPGGRRDRRALKREKRRLRKARRRPQPGDGDSDPGDSDPGDSGRGDAGDSDPGDSDSDRGDAGDPGDGGRGDAAPGHPGDPDPPQAPPPRARAPSRPRAGPSAARRRALLAANEQEDREIRRLERCLGLRRRRKRGGQGGGGALPPGFARDGLGYVLGALEAGRGAGLYDDSSGGEDSDPDPDPDPDPGAGPTPRGRDLDSDAEDGGDGAGGEGEESELESEEEEEEEEEEAEVEAKTEAKTEGTAEAGQSGPKRVRFAPDGESGRTLESSDAAAQGLHGNGAGLVPPPSRRAEGPADARKEQELETLKRRIKGLINRLSEPNMASISGQLQELYAAHSRKDVNDTLAAVLLAACAPATAVPRRLLMEHALLLSILHRTVGLEVGAHFLEAVVRRFDAAYRACAPGKECENLLALLGHLYCFGVVHARLLLDLLGRLAAAFAERDVELLLLALRDVGFALRRDDALALRELVAEVQAKAAAADGRLRDQTRVRFMLETLLALRNNDVRKLRGYDPEPAERLRRLQRTLVRGAGADAPLRVSWDSVLNAPRTGRWWVVGSAWSGAPMIEGGRRADPQPPPAGTVSAKLLALARRQRMNTDVRRRVFCALMTSEDFLDAFEKLLRLGLKGPQERDIVHVLADCCLQEKSYNPFYAFLAARLCAHERRFQVTLRFGLWDKLRDLERLPAASASNLAQLLAHLLRTKALPLSVLKVLEFSELDKPRARFLRRVLRQLLLETEPEDLARIFGRVAENPKLGVFREGLKLFVGHFLLRRAGPAEPLRARAELAAGALQGRASLRM